MSIPLVRAANTGGLVMTTHTDNKDPAALLRYVDREGRVYEIPPESLAPRGT